MSKFKQTLFGLTATAVLFLATTLPLSAAVVVVNDAVFGTDSVLRDTTNNTDFLRLDFTMAHSYSSIQSEFGPGGAFEGWSVASLTQMENLGLSAGVIHGSSIPADVALAEDLRDWFCPVGTCVNLSTTHEYARGLISDVETAVPGLAQKAFSIGRNFNVTPHAVDFRVSGYGYWEDTSEEIFLTRTAVPLPAAAWLFISGMAGLGVFGRRRQK